jgi:DDE family transposase
MVVLKSPTNRRPRMASIASSLKRIKDNPLSILGKGLIESVCRERDYLWRERELDPATTFALCMQQVVRGNIPCSEVRHVASSVGPKKTGSFTPQAFCGARARLPLAIYQTLLTEVYQQIVPVTRREEHLWHGHRTFHIDGSTFSMPDTPELRKAFGMPSGQKKGCGFPVAHLLMLFSAATGMLIDVWASPLRTGDLAETPEAHLHLDAGDILIGDDTFSGYPHMALLKKQDLHGVFPVHHKRIVDFKKGRPHCGEGKKSVAGMPRSRWIKSLGKEDQLVEYFKSSEKPEWMAQSEWESLPESIIVRELRRTVVRPASGKITITLVTTLTDPVKYPAADLLELRLRRWDVETNIGHLKTTMKMDVLRCKTEAGIRKELAVFAMVYNMVRVIMTEAAYRQEVPVSRISFADAYKWMRHARPGDSLPKLIVNPHRPNRIEPRCKKRRPKQFDLMNKPRAELRKLLKNKRKKA